MQKVGLMSSPHREVKLGPGYAMIRSAIKCVLVPSTTSYGTWWQKKLPNRSVVFIVHSAGWS